MKNDRDRKAFKGLSFQEFQSKYNSDKYFDLFQKYLDKNGLVLQLEKSRGAINQYIIAEFARQLYGEDYFYQIVLKQDEMVKKVLSKK